MFLLFLSANQSDYVSRKHPTDPILLDRLVGPYQVRAGPN